MKLLNTAIIRLTIVLLAGIFTGFYTPLPLSWLLFLLAGLFIIFILAFLRSEKLLVQDKFFGGSCLSLFFVLGIVTVQLHQPGNQELHYSNQNIKKDSSLLVSITEELKPDLYREKYVAEVLKLNDSKAHGKILLLLPHNESNLSIGDRFLLGSSLDSLPAPLNPQQFNYRKFMANRGILLQTEPSPAEILSLDPEAQDPKQATQNYREKIITKLRRQNFGKEELAVIQALLLGQRRDLSQETNENYAAAGVMHILAVSGLHVGIILLLLNRLLSFLDRKSWGKLTKTFLLLLLLWAYALLAGFSPSIVRAVCMFSFVAVGMQLKRQTNVLNSLFLSLMLLLLFRPNWAREVGFQLSYLAVISIAILQPLLFNMLVLKNSVLRYFWSLFTVTLAAQVGVLPLSLFYFHQFPGLFFISNLVILPFLGIILGLGILIILLTMLDLLPAVLAQCLNFLIKGLNKFVEWMALQENFLFQDIQFTQSQLFAFYALLLSIILLCRGFTLRRLSQLLCVSIYLQGVLIFEAVSKNEKELIVFHKNRQTFIGQTNNKHLILAHNSTDSARYQGMVRNYILVKAINSYESEALRNIYFWENEWLMLIDSSSVYLVPGLHPETILLSNSPKINLDRLLRDLKPKQIIADGSNYRTYVNRWRKTCRKKKIPFHYTGEKGSFILGKRAVNLQIPL